MYRVNVDNIDTLNKFLSINDIEYLDAIIDKDGAILVSNTVEMFAAIQLDVFPIDKESKLMLRIPKKLFSSLVTQGYFLISVFNEIVTLKFFVNENDMVENTCTIEFNQQDVWTEGYTNKLELLSEIEDKVVYDISGLSNILRIGASNKTVLNCNNKIASITINSTTKVFQSLTTDMRFSVPAASLFTLSKISKHVFDYKNYLGISKDGFTVLCTKARGEDNEIFTLIKEEKSSFICNVDLRYIHSFLNKIKISSNTVNLDIDAGEVLIEDNTRKYRIPVMVKDLRKSSVCSECVVTISKAILDIFSKMMQNNIVTLSNKRTFVLLEYKDIAVCFRS